MEVQVVWEIKDSSDGRISDDDLFIAGSNSTFPTNSVLLLCSHYMRFLMAAVMGLWTHDNTLDVDVRYTFYGHPVLIIIR